MISTSTQGSVTKHVDYSKAFSVKFAEFIGFSIKIVQLSYTAVGNVVHLFCFLNLSNHFAFALSAFTDEICTCSIEYGLQTIHRNRKPPLSG